MMNYKTVSKYGILSKLQQAKVARDYIAQIGTACRDENQSVAYLSGGNQPEGGSVQMPQRGAQGSSSG